MSEYQYYEFLALDRPLTQLEQQELRGVSSRAKISSTRFSNFCHYGDLRAEPIDVLLRYFDVFVYVSNFGSRCVAFRFPLGSLDRDLINCESLSHAVEIHENAEFEAAEFVYSNEPDGYYDEGDEWMGRLSAVRDVLLRRDQRPGYIAWLGSLLGFSEVDDDAVEPPVPPGLNAQTPWLNSLAEFLGVDEYLLAAAAEESDDLVTDRRLIASELSKLDERVKDTLLAEVYRGKHTKVIAKLTRLISSNDFREAKPERLRRCALEIRDRADDIQRAIVAERARRETEERRKREAADAVLRRRKLKRLATRQDETWGEIEELVASTRQDSYDRAIHKLIDLRDIAEMEATESIFARRLDALREMHVRKSSFIRRLEQAELI